MSSLENLIVPGFRWTNLKICQIALAKFKSSSDVSAEVLTVDATQANVALGTGVEGWSLTTDVHRDADINDFYK